MIKFAWGKSDSNCHGTEKKGEPWNKQTVKGWKLRFVRLEGFTKKEPGFRLIVYLPSGAWLYFDVYYVQLTQEVKEQS